MTKKDFFTQFEEVIALQSVKEICNFLDSQNISDVEELITEYPDHEISIIANLSTQRAVATFKILEVPAQKRIIQALPPLKSAELLNELPPDDRTAFFEELPSTVVTELIKTLNFEERKTTLALLGYPEDSVGRLMTPDYLAVKPNWTVLQTLKLVRRLGKDTETIDVIYVINDNGELLDDIRIKEFLLVDPEETRVKDLMDNRVISLQVDDDQEIANNTFKMNNRVALPVVDKMNILLGIVTIDDVLWVANEEFSEDITKIGGTEALDEPYLETPLFKLIGKRASWLVVLFIGELFTASAMSFFEDEIKKVLVLNMLVPLIISSGGNSGSQASTLIIQAMAKGEIAVTEWYTILKREFKSGLVLGALLGMLGFIRTFMWSKIEPSLYGLHTLRIGLVTFTSVLGVVLWGTLTGSMLPLFLKKMKLDPATSSAPFVATLVDVTGIVIYFSMAYLFFKGILL